MCVIRLAHVCVLLQRYLPTSLMCITSVVAQVPKNDVEEHFQLKKFMNIIVEWADALLSNNLANFEKLVMSNKHYSWFFMLWMKNGKLQIDAHLLYKSKFRRVKNPPWNVIANVFDVPSIASHKSTHTSSQAARR